MLRLFLLLLILWGTAARSPADEPVAPFVAGFDRFGRHEEIDAATAGRLLLSELSCTACHTAEEQTLAPKAGPRLDGVADRLDRDWLRGFLSSPQTVKPGTTMPDVLAGVAAQDRETIIDALLAFLSTQHEPWPVPKAGGANPVLHRFWERGDRENGRRLYHTVGCVACHEADPDYETAEVKPSPLDELLEQLDPEEIAEMGLAAAVRPVKPVPHPDLPAKYSRQSLTFFLLQPETIRTAGRMPSLKLEPFEAADIATWLLREQTREITLPTSDDAALIERGRALFSSLGCANCHSAGTAKPQAATALARLDRVSEQSCIGESVPGRPHYLLDDVQRGAVHAALGEKESRRSTTIEQLDFRLLQLNCYGCHERDGRGGIGRNVRPYFETVGNVDIGDEGRIPPPLAGVGRKLEAAWLTKVLQGTGDIRPHMLVRMPRFPGKSVADLPDLLADVDREGEAPAEPLLEAASNSKNGSVGASPSQRAPSEEQLIEAGRALMDVGCVQCHSFGGEALPGVVGIDLIGVPQRIRPGWFHAFLLDPGSLKERTRMPSFFPGGKSQNRDVLEGVPDLQIAAMWAYLKAGGEQPLPAKIEEARRQDYELKPTERAIVLRTFMPEAGTHAIAVGLPAGVHYAFDAQGTWFSRFAPPASPLGEAVVTLADGPSLAWLTNRDEPWPSAEQNAPGNRFRGYRVDEKGVPTFLYDIGPARVEEQITAGSDGVLVRRLMVRLADDESPAGTLWLRAAAGRGLKVQGDQCVSPDGLSVRMTGTKSPELRQNGQTAEWLAPVPLARNRATLEVHYKW
jgi:mono/diheme cytochrome c family protein/cytochrome c553